MKIVKRILNISFKKRKPTSDEFKIDSPKRRLHLLFSFMQLVATKNEASTAYLTKYSAPHLIFLLT